MILDTRRGYTRHEEEEARACCEAERELTLAEKVDNIGSMLHGLCSRLKDVEGRVDIILRSVGG